MPLILVTGATGEVARGVLPELEKHFDLRLLALDPPKADSRYVQADVRDWQALTQAMQGVDAVLHLAIAAGHSGTYEDDAFNDRRFDVNVKGTYHVFETARRARVRRVVHISSVMVTWGHARQLRSLGSSELVPGNAAPLPVGTYALTKTLAEGIARQYAQGFDMEILTLRIAAPLDVKAPDLRQKPIRPQQIPFPDLAQAFIKALTVPFYQYAIVTVAGHSSRTLWSLDAAREVLGYEPQYYLDDLGVKFVDDPFAVARE